MNKVDRLINKIRKEDVVLWLGAGCSIGAGYPSARALQNIILEFFSENELKEIDQEAPLDRLADEFCNLRSPEELVQRLKEYFDKLTIKDSNFHSTVASIPHFQTIITTNYDSLIEDAYQAGINIIRKDEDLVSIDNNKPTLFKVHGDFAAPEKLIISSQDYNDFWHHRMHESLVWKSITSELSKKVLLFIGYSLDDSNAKSTIRELNDKLVENRKEIYLIAPGLRLGKKNFLQNLNIHYIDTTGEEFLQRLDERLKKVVYQDAKKGDISQNTLSKYLENKGLNAKIIGNHNNFDIHSLTSNKGKIQSNLRFTLPAAHPKVNCLNELVQGNTFDGIDLPISDLDNFAYLVDDFDLTPTETDLLLSIRSLPSSSGAIEVHFENGDSFHDLPFKNYTSKNKLRLELTIYDFTLNLEVVKSAFPEVHTSASSTIKFNIDFSLPEIFSSSSKAIKALSFLINLFSEQKFDAILPNGTVFSNNLSSNQEAVNDLKAYRAFFRKLEILEKSCHYRFRNIETRLLNTDNFKSLSTLVDLLRPEGKFEDLNGPITVGVPDEDGWQSKLQNADYVISVVSPHQYHVNLLDRTATIKELQLDIPAARLAKGPEVLETGQKAIQIASAVNKVRYRVNPIHVIWTTGND